MRTYNKEEVYLEELDGLIKEIRIMGKKIGVPALGCFAIEEKNGATVYKSFINTAPDLIGMLSQDLIPDCVNVMFNGFKAVKYDVMEDDMANHNETNSLPPDGKEEKKLHIGVRGKRFDLTPAFAEDLEKSVDEVVSICRKKGVYFMMVFALSDDGEKTEYRVYSNAPQKGPLGLKDDIISKGLKIVMEGYTSAVEDVAEDIQDNAVPWRGSVAGAKKEKTEEDSDPPVKRKPRSSWEVRHIEKS